MSNEENRQTPAPEGLYPNYNPGTQATPGANLAQGQAQGQGQQAMPGAFGGFGQSPYQQVPTGYQLGGPVPQVPSQSPMSQLPMQQMQQMPAQAPQQQSVSNVPGMLPVEESYIENILRLNKGKVATVYMTFENNDRWNAKVFKGVVEAAGRDHIILSDPETGRRYLLLMVYLDYVTFDEELNYEYPFASGAGRVSNYPPR